MVQKTAVMRGRVWVATMDLLAWKRESMMVHNWVGRKGDRKARNSAERKDTLKGEYWAQWMDVSLVVLLVVTLAG